MRIFAWLWSLTRLDELLLLPTIDAGEEITYLSLLHEFTLIERDASRPRMNCVLPARLEHQLDRHEQADKAAAKWWLAKNVSNARLRKRLDAIPHRLIVKRQRPRSMGKCVPDLAQLV